MGPPRYVVIIISASKAVVHVGNVELADYQGSITGMNAGNSGNP